MLALRNWLLGSILAQLLACKFALSDLVRDYLEIGEVVQTSVARSRSCNIQSMQEQVCLVHAKFSIAFVSMS